MGNNGYTLVNNRSSGNFGPLHTLLYLIVNSSSLHRRQVYEILIKTKQTRRVYTQNVYYSWCFFRRPNLITFIQTLISHHPLNTNSSVQLNPIVQLKVEYHISGHLFLAVCYTDVYSQNASCCWPGEGELLL